MAKAAFTARIARTPTSIDAALGARIRARRAELKMSQDQLAAAIGVTFQQVQKYEKGVNRVAASTLVDICQALQMTPAGLLPSLQGEDTQSMLASEELNELAQIVAVLDLDERATLMQVARALQRKAKHGAPAKRAAKSPNKPS